MRWTRTAPVLMLAMLLGGPGWVAAQSTSSSGMFGNRTTGSGISAGTGSAFGSNSPMSGLGQSGGQGTPSMNNPNGVGGQARTPGSFIGANSGQAAQQNFVGAGQANPSGASQSGMGNLNLGSFGMGAFVGRRLGQGYVGPGMNGAAAAPTPAVRTTLTLGFEPAAAPAGQVNSAIAEHLRALPALHWQSAAKVEMQGRTAILRGVVATEHDRDLAERVVRLEATVDQVQNLIEVAAPAMPKKMSPAEHTRPAEHIPAGEHAPAAGNSAAGNSATGPALVPPAPAEILPPLPVMPGAK